MRLRLLTIFVVLAIRVQAGSLGAMLLEQAIGSLTSDKNEVISGTRSIKGAYNGNNSYTPYFRSDPSRMPLQAGQTYRATFRYKILTTPDRGFEVLFYSPKGGAQNNFLPSQTVTGPAGQTGTVTLTNTLNNFDDYQIRWNVVGRGAIAIDDVQVVNVATGAILGAEDAEPGTFLLSTFFVSANKTSFVWGEPVKVTAAFYDETGKPASPGPVSWTVSPPTAASVAADGTVTPRSLSTFTVRGTMLGIASEVALQALPRKIVVTAENASMLVGSTQRMRADALDVSGNPIPNVTFRWTVAGQYYPSSPSAVIDSAGMLKGVLQGRVRVVAAVSYSQAVPLFDLISQGETTVEIKAPSTYRLERIFVARPSGASSSVLAPRPTPLIPTESGGFMFAASLDGLGSALVEWKDGAVTPIVASGRVNIATGNPLADILNYNRNAYGDILVQETDASGAQLVSHGLPGVIAPMIARGSALFGTQGVSQFTLSRSSLADSGAMAIYVNYVDAVTRLGATAIYRGYGGLSEPVVTNRDKILLRADGSPGWVDQWGITNDATVWFEGSDGGMWRSRPGKPPQKVLGSGDPVADGIYRNYIVNYSPAGALLYVAGNGDVVTAVSTDKGNRFLLFHDTDSVPSLTLAATAHALFSYDPASGALIEATPAGRPRGMYLWNSAGARPVLLLNDTSIDGSPVQEILSACIAPGGAIYAMVRTDANPMLIARVDRDVRVLLKSGDSIGVSVPPVVTALIQGVAGGIPDVVAGGASCSIARLDTTAGTITPLVAVGTQLPDGKYFAGTKPAIVRSIQDGQIVFAADLFAQDSSIYVWNSGTVQVAVRAPVKNADNSGSGAPNSIEVNRQGDFTFQLGWNGSPVYRSRGGDLQNVFPKTATVDNIAMRASLRGIDDAGNVILSATRVDGTGFFALKWDGESARTIFTSGLKMPDGRQVSALDSLFTCGDSLIAGVLGNTARYRDGSWGYLTDPTQPLATGATANTIRLNAVNRNCDTVFSDAAGGIGGFIGARYHEIYDLQQFTPEGDLLTIFQTLVNDDGTVYLLGANDRGEEVVYRASPTGP